MRYSFKVLVLKASNGLPALQKTKSLANRSTRQPHYEMLTIDFSAQSGRRYHCSGSIDSRGSPPLPCSFFFFFFASLIWNNNSAHLCNSSPRRKWNGKWFFFAPLHNTWSPLCVPTMQLLCTRAWAQRAVCVTCNRTGLRVFKRFPPLKKNKINKTVVFQCSFSILCIEKQCRGFIPKICFIWLLLYLNKNELLPLYFFAHLNI